MLSNFRRPQVVLYEFEMSSGNYLLCPLMLFITLCLRDSVFADIRTPEELFSLRVPSDRVSLEIPFRKEVIDLPLFRTCKASSSAKSYAHASPEAPFAMNYAALDRDFRALLMRIGLPEIPCLYELRRGFANALNDCGKSTRSRKRVIFP